MVLSSACISVAIIAHTLMIKRCAPSASKSPDLDFGTAAALMASEKVGERAPVLGVDVDVYTHTGAERRIIGLALNLHPHADALHDLHPIAARILRRQQRELGTARGADALDRSRPGTVMIRVDINVHLIADPHIGE